MSEASRAASAAARAQRWWIPWVVLAAILVAYGSYLWAASDRGDFRGLGRVMIGAAALALLGVALTFSGLGRAIMGIQHHDRRLFPFLFNFRGWFQAAVILVAFSGVSLLEYTMEPDFCQSCHIMQPYHQGWHQSTHIGVACTDCHFEPGVKGTLKGKFQASSMLMKQITETYGSRPHAQIQDASCMRSGCHAERMSAGMVKWSHEKPNGAVIEMQFNHTPHLTELRRGRQLRCVSCHSEIVHGRQLTVSLDSCFICHFKGLVHNRDEEVLGGCTVCHAAPKDQIRLVTGTFNHKDYIGRGVACFNCHSDSIKGDGAVPRQVCLNCHNKLVDLERYGEANFIHDNHIAKHKLECTTCHMQIEHRLDAHVQTAATDCARCHTSMHSGPEQMYKGTGGRGVPDMPSPMYRAQVDCIACHQFEENMKDQAAIAGQTFVAHQKSCDLCHGDTVDPSGGKYATRLADWKQGLGELSKKAHEAVAGAETALKAAGLSDAAALPMQRKLADARHNLAFVELGKGAHNFNYAVALLNTAIANCQEITTATPASANEPGTDSPG